MPRLAHHNLPPLRLDGMTIGQRLRRLRREHGYTQTQFAASVGITQTLVSDYERGKISPAAEMVVRFAKALDVSTDELLGLGPHPQEAANGRPHGNSRIIRRLKKLEALPPEDQKAVLRTIDALVAANTASHT